MVYRHRKKKVEKMRGKHTHGWGSKKKRRGAGSHGGRGMGGSGKRGDVKKPFIIKHLTKNYFGKHGFTPHYQYRKLIPLNIYELSSYDLKEEDGYFPIELKGYKLLGKGNPNRKYKIRVERATKKAITKIEKFGGIVEILKENKKKD